MQTIQVSEPEPGRLYTLEATAYLTGLSRRAVLLYCKAGVIQPVVEPQYGSLFFDDASIHRVRRAELLRVESGMNRMGAALFFGLLREMDMLREELRFYRGF